MVKWQKMASLVCVAACAVVCAAFLLPEKGVQARTQSVKYLTMTDSVGASGALAYEAEYLAAPAQPGIVSAVYVDKGQRVKAGDALFRLDSSSLEASLSALTYGAQAGGALAAQAPQAQTLMDMQAASLKAQIAAMTVRAPCDGVVLSVGVSEGTAAAGGVAIGQGKLCARLYVADTDLDGIEPGQQVELRRGSKSVSAQVVAMEASAERPGYFAVTTSAADFEGALVGMQTEGTIIRSRTSCLCIPISALYATQDAVLCVREGVAVKVEVTLGAQDAYYVAVTGLEKDDIVVLEPEGIQEGARIELEEGDAGEGGDEDR